MCGLVALFSPSEPIHASVFDVMRDRLIHRGPDSGATWVADTKRVGLAHRRLSILDTSHASDQPMVSADGRLHIVFNGEIYNYVELRGELQKEGVVFRTPGDTEVLLAAYERWGEEAISKLNGMFAFAIWDQRRREMFVARDRFGEKPLFVGRAEAGVVILASEMKAILAHPQMRASASEAALARYGAGRWYEDDALTFFENIERFEPAHAAVFRENGTVARKWRYWTPDYEAVDRGISRRDAVERFAELLDRSVSMRLRSDVPLGSSLSGGLDSSAIVGLLARHRERTSFTQNTFSAVFEDDPTISEEQQVDEVVRFTGVTSHKVMPNAESLMKESASLHWHQEEPFLSASIYLQWCVARLAKSANTTVLLDGQGADELLGGYQFWYKSRQLDLLEQNRLPTAMWETYQFNRRLKRTARGYVDSQRRFNAKVAYTMAELWRMKGNAQYVAPAQYSEGVVSPAPGNRIRRLLGESLQYNVLPMLLRYADRNAMAFSREGRFPFLDYDLVDFCQRMPDDILLKDGWQKWPLRKSTSGIMPEQIRWRADKVGYAAPLDIWLRNGLKQWAQERAFSSRLNDVPGYDRAALEQLWNAHQTGLANNSWAIWQWISLSEWMDLLDRGVWKASELHA